MEVGARGPVPAMGIRPSLLRVFEQLKLGKSETVPSAALIPCEMDSRGVLIILVSGLAINKHDSEIWVYKRIQNN